MKEQVLAKFGRDDEETKEKPISMLPSSLAATPT
jgi:hypothetical protein